MIVTGYKAFKGDLKNKYGKSFEVGMVYSKNPDTLQFGENGHGYHMAAKLADTFRFFNPVNDNVYCEVLGFGKIVKVDNHLYDSDAMYVAEHFKITKVLSRKDIFEYVCKCDLDEFRRCLFLIPFTKDELEVLRDVALVKGVNYNHIFFQAKKYQIGDVSSFKRNPKYLRKNPF